MQLESSLEKVCQQLVANDPNLTTATLQWSKPPFEEETQLVRFLDCLAKNQTLTRLVLRDLDTLDDCKSLAAAIQKHPKLTALQFFGRLPTTNDFSAFCQVFQDKPQLNELEFKGCDKVPAVVINGIQSILQNNDIDTFLMNDCRLESTEELERLSQALLLSSSSSKPSVLRKLQIAVKRSLPSGEAVKHVAQFLQSKSSAMLQDLHLEGFLETNAIAALFQAAAGHKSLRRLKLTGTAVNDESMKSVGQLLDSNVNSDDSPGALRILDLSSCDIHGEGSMHLAKAVAKNSTLRELYLSYNWLGDDGIRALSKLLGEETEKTTSQLEVLDVRLNRIGSGGIRALANALCSNTTLRALHIGEEFVIPGRRFEVDDIKDIVEMLVQNKTLQELYMEDASIGDSDFVTLLDAFPKNTTLHQWTTSCFSTASLERLVATLSALHLEKLFIRVHGDVLLDEALCDKILQNLEKNSDLNVFDISGLKDDSDTKWRALEPRVQAMLSTQTKIKEDSSSPNKRLPEDENDGDKTAKRPRGEETG